MDFVILADERIKIKESENLTREIQNVMEHKGDGDTCTLGTTSKRLV